MAMIFYKPSDLQVYLPDLPSPVIGRRAGDEGVEVKSKRSLHTSAATSITLRHPTEYGAQCTAPSIQNPIFPLLR